MEDILPSIRQLARCQNGILLVYEEQSQSVPGGARCVELADGAELVTVLREIWFVPSESDLV